MRRNFLWLWLALIFFPVFPAVAQSDLPPLLYAAPSLPYEVLTPVGAGKKTILEAREQLQREAAKAQAEAVILLGCEAGGIARNGLSWSHKDSYCRGLAIRSRSGAGFGNALRPPDFGKH
ncbi:MAG TPA: hypothetical protein DF383_12785 [Deltaproteobacteria bacterium]|nr:hypothetical protein [Deltaproteobacteria bacterium]